MMIRLTIPGVPVAKQRARVTSNGTFNPRETSVYKSAIQLAAKSNKARYGWQRMEGPLKVVIDLYLRRPAKPKWQVPAVKPDADNFAKALLDGLNAIVWIDDGQVVQLTVTKHYADPLKERAEVFVEAYGL